MSQSGIGPVLPEHRTVGLSHTTRMRAVRALVGVCMVGVCIVGMSMVEVCMQCVGLRDVCKLCAVSLTRRGSWLSK